jgi:L,D-transpeptidase catalytic domain
MMSFLRSTATFFLTAGFIIGATATVAEAQGQQAAPPPVVTARTKSPKPTMPKDVRGQRVLRAANAYRGKMKILVSIDDRWLWLVSGRDTLMSTQIAIGRGEDFEFEGKKFRFETPRSRRRVLKKEEAPRWTVPDWHYMERAHARNLELVRLTKEDKIQLADSSFLMVIGDNVGRLNHYGNFWAFTPGLEIIFDGKVFMPPMGTQQRQVPEALGPYKLDMGDGYLLHGTNIFNEDTIGDAVSHGCVRLTNEDLDRLYHMVPVGTPVFIF